MEKLEFFIRRVKHAKPLDNLFKLTAAYITVFFFVCFFLKLILVGLTVRQNVYFNCTEEASPKV